MYTRIVQFLAALLALFALQSCISRARTAQIYILPSTPAVVESDSASGRSSTHIAVSIPGFLRRIEMRALNSATGEIKTCAGCQWAAPLQELLAEAFANTLPGKTLAIDCTAFAPDFDGVFQAAGTMEISTDKGVVSKKFAFTLQSPNGAAPLTPAAIARQYSEAVFQLSQLACQE